MLMRLILFRIQRREFFRMQRARQITLPGKLMTEPAHGLRRQTEPRQLLQVEKMIGFIAMAQSEMIVVIPPPLRSRRQKSHAFLGVWGVDEGRKVLWQRRQRNLVNHAMAV